MTHVYQISDRQNIIYHSKKTFLRLLLSPKDDKKSLHSYFQRVFIQYAGYV